MSCQHGDKPRAGIDELVDPGVPHRSRGAEPAAEPAQAASSSAMSNKHHWAMMPSDAPSPLVLRMWPATTTPVMLSVMTTSCDTKTPKGYAFADFADPASVQAGAMFEAGDLSVWGGVLVPGSSGKAEPRGVQRLEPKPTGP
eukprot:Skav235816  [mRNA]  locus=scaffold1267:390955:398637:- [translate_table: standard]